MLLWRRPENGNLFVQLSIIFTNPLAYYTFLLSNKSLNLAKMSWFRYGLSSCRKRRTLFFTVVAVNCKRSPNCHTWYFSSPERFRDIYFYFFLNTFEQRWRRRTRGFTDEGIMTSLLFFYQCGHGLWSFEKRFEDIFLSRVELQKILTIPT